MTPGNHTRVVRAASVCFIILFLLLAVYFGREILFPVLMAMLFAILLRPMVSFMHTKMRFPHMIAVAVAVLIGLAVALGVLYFLTAQVASFMADLPAIKKNVDVHLQHIQQWINETFKVSTKEQNEYLANMSKKSQMVSTDSLGSVTGSLLQFILIPIYTFLILMYRTLFLRFLRMVTAPEHHAVLQEIVFEVKSVVRSYISGLLLELLIVGAMTSVGLWIIGVEYFIFLGILTAVLNLIPYVGIMIALIICVFVSMVSSTEISTILGVLAVNAVVQLIDNNILMPRIVGSKVSINALASIVAVIIGGHLAGVAGMFLAIPVVAIMKVIFDRIEGLKPFGFLMGDTIPKTFNWYNIRFPDFNAGGQDNHDDADKQEEAREIL